MIGALFYLRLTSLKNMAQSRLKRLRQPKYLFGAIAGGAYLWFFFLRHAVVPVNIGPPGHQATSPEIQSLPLMFIAVPVIILAAKRVIEAWVAPDSKPGLAFTEAEVAFLFPAPMTRRRLVHYKLLSSQFSILISSLVMALVSSRWAGLGGNFLIHALGIWVIFSTLNLHTIGAAFTVTRLIDGGVSRVRRQLAVIGVAVLFLAAVGFVAWQTSTPPTEAQLKGPLAFMRYASGLTDNGALFWILLPFKIVLAPFLAATWMEFLAALGPALLLLIVHYVWVVRAETSFEEASIALAEKRTAMLAALQEGKYRIGVSKPKARRGPFRLSSAGGRPEVAFLWKNLLSTSGFFRPLTFFIFAGFIAAVCGWFYFAPGQRSKLIIVVFLGIISSVYTLLFGPQVSRQDLRSDLAHTDILKSYPLAGWQVLLGEILAPTAILTGMLWLALLAVTLSLHSRSLAWLTLDMRIVGTVSIAILIPAVCALQMLVPNGAAVLLPGWMQSSRRMGERGIEMLGQRLIFVLGQLLVILLSLIPATLAAIASIGICYLVFHEVNSFAVGVATVSVLIIVVAEIAVGLWWLGQRFEKFDLSAELRT